MHQTLLGVPGEPPGRADAQSGAAVEESEAVNAARKADERIDRAEDEGDRKRVLPERHSDERASRGEHERR